jgi:altronate hydrolase/altronate dehydratase small subunit
MNESKPTAFRIQSSDNVATLLSDAAEGGEVRLTGGTSPSRIRALEPIKAGHKIAVADIEQGKSVIKFGVAIGQARAAVSAGAWVHLHNCASNYDARSATLDAETGAATDTKYE